ncbi:MAG: trehalase family glycosidase [Rariglobus sp.]
MPFSSPLSDPGLPAVSTVAAAERSQARGRYFAKKTARVETLPTFARLRAQLPAPRYDVRPEWIEMYWKAWELACRNFHQPAPGSGFVSSFIDAAFNENIFLWDTCFMSFFCNVAHPLVPGIQSLDNFYARQHDTGEISREIVRMNGEDYGPWVNKEGRPLYSSHGWDNSAQRDTPVTYIGRATPQPPPHLTLDALNNPLCAWAEVESYRFTGDAARLALVYPALERYYRALQHYLRQGNGLYLTDWASMDNSPRNKLLAGGGCAVDTSAQMVLFARNLADIASVIGDASASGGFEQEAARLAHLINELLWDDERRFYFDLTAEGKRTPIKTVAAFWTLLAGVAQPHQVEGLSVELNNRQTFARHHRVPTLAADEAGYDPQGGYWCGAVWAPTTTMVIRGLERSGRSDLAREIALNDLEVTGRVFQQTGTVWENYAPDADQPGTPAKGDFVGWTGITPILHFLEQVIGLKADAPANALTWRLNESGAVGCDLYRFNGHVTSLQAGPVDGATSKRTLTVESDGDYALLLHHAGVFRTFEVKAGSQTWIV